MKLHYNHRKFDKQWCFKSITLYQIFLLYSLYYAEACYELAGPNSALLRPGNTVSLEKMSQLWRAVGNKVFDLTGSRFEPQTSWSRDKRVTARPTGRCNGVFIVNLFCCKCKRAKIIHNLWRHENREMY